VTKLRGCKKGSGIFLLCTAMVVVSHAQTFTTMISFDGNDGAYPYCMSLVQGVDGKLYGTTYAGGDLTCNSPIGCGLVFRITPWGTLTTLHTFEGTDGAGPDGGLIQTSDGNLYGTTYYGGAYGNGTVFKITSGGEFTTLHNFNKSDGYYPYGGLVQAMSGYFYGTTSYGGAYDFGTAFAISSGGTLTTLHSFNLKDGAMPQAGMIQAMNGNFYGTAYYGGAYGAGTVFEMTPTGTLTTLHSFNGTDGYYPYAGLVQTANGDLFGTTWEGGTAGNCPEGCGTIFEITPQGTFSTLHSFDSTDGAYPYSGLLQATDGNFYGTTGSGGAFNWGTVFRINRAGTLTTLHSFCGQADCPDGEDPAGGLVQFTNGTFYGTTSYGGSGTSCMLDCGTVFSLSVGLGPFVETKPSVGKVGTVVTILGTNLSDANGVSFNGTPATFIVVSNSEIRTTVPSGATTGPVTVLTARGTLTSNKRFWVVP
jgi:uncharacterized repeat protein (TIGR03803 family)